MSENRSREISENAATPSAHCRSCGATIVWIRTTAGKPIPCDPPVLAVVTDQGEVVRGRQSHFVSCPQAGEWRKR